MFGPCLRLIPADTGLTTHCKEQHVAVESKTSKPHKNQAGSLTEDLAGRQFGRLTVLQMANTRTPAGRIKWRVKCECGVEKDVQAMSLKRGDTTSCGCLHREGLIARSTKHGFSHASEYRSFYSMINRCTNPNNQDYSRYGGRGIKVCERWQKFDNFLADMGQKPTPKHTIERNDGNKDYEPSNCRWATQREQTRNICTNVKTSSGAILADEADRLGVSRSTLYSRVWKLGWGVEEAINTPIRDRN